MRLISPPSGIIFGARKLAGKAKILAVIKADAYGHGMVNVAV